ncbi:MAG: ABC transporter substrate-binding protein, partial [Deltaproteobacteria bacterium]|nr:ABC transporter substrate-binding protein [Deltaproteobacteria bacterium]
AVDQVNSDTQHNPIKLIVEDSQSQASRAVTSFTKLVNINKVPVIAGLLTSDEALACAPLAIKHKVVLFTPGAISEKLKEAGSYVFRNRESVELQTAAIANECVERTEGGKIAILHANAANAISYRDTFMAACEALGANIVGSVPFNEGKMDYRSELEQLRALSPASVYLAGYDSELGLILKQAREIGLEVNFFASAGAVTPKLLEIAPKGAEGLIAASASFDPQSTVPYVRDFVDAYTARFGKEPDWLAANSYDAIQMLAQIAEKNQFDSQQIRDGLIGMKNFPGVSGTTTFDRNGGVKKSIALVRVQNGKFLQLIK